MPGSVASGTHCVTLYKVVQFSAGKDYNQFLYLYIYRYEKWVIKVDYS